MKHSRRGFLGNSFLGIAYPFVGNLPGLGPQNEQKSSQGTPPLPFDESVFRYWNSQVRQPYWDFKTNSTGKGVKQSQPEDSTFVFYSEETGFVLASDLDPTKLKPTDPKKTFPDSGDANVQVHVERFRPTGQDLANLKTLETGTLRIDLAQKDKLPELPEALAWTAMATLISGKKGKGGTPPTDPNKDNMGAFDPGKAWGQFQSVPLTGGLGFWTWNFFMKKQQGFWKQLLDHMFQVLHTAGPYLPLLGIPGIAVSGLTYVDKILGAIQAQGDSQWLFQGLDSAVCATKDSIDKAGGKDAAKVILTNGTYLITRNSTVSQLKGLAIRDGLVVPPNTAPLDVFDAAKDTLKDQTYLTVSVAVTTSTTTSKPSSSGAKPSTPVAKPPASSQSKPPKR
jgi:hypothetical protein